MSAPIARRTSPSRKIPAATNGALISIGSPHSDPGARSPRTRPGPRGGGEQKPEVHTVDRVPEVVREERLDTVRSEGREERPDADVDRLEQWPDQQGHPEGGTDDPEDGAPDDSLDEVVDRSERLEWFDETPERRMEDQRENDAPDDAARVVDDSADDEVDRRIREAVRETQDQISVQVVEVEFGQSRSVEPQPRHRGHMRRDECGDDRALTSVAADQELDVRGSVLPLHALPPAGHADFII